MKLVLDTNVWIAFFREPARKADLDSRMQRPLMLMSSVVALELHAGCRTTRQRKALAGLLKPFEKAGRILTPDHGCYREAGRILAELGTEGIGAAHLRQIVNDVLIAVSAAKAGAVVVTAKSQDFSRIEKHLHVRWMRAG